MPCPPDIRDALESVVDVFFSGVRHRERAAFILCDNLVEVACRIRAIQHNHAFSGRGFHTITTAPGVRLGVRLQAKVQGYHNTRNNLQHVGAALTVDAAHCADAVSDAVRVLDKLWAGTSARLGATLPVALRVVRLFGSSGDALKQAQFEERMRAWTWRTTDDERVAAAAVQIRPGVRDSWGHALRFRAPDVETILNQIEAPA